MFCVSKRKSVVSFLVIFAFLCGLILLGVGEKKLTVVRANGVVSLAYGAFPEQKAETPTEVLNILERYSDEYGFADIYSELQYDKVLSDGSGLTYVFNQYYRGFPVYGRQVKVSTTARGDIDSVTGNYLSGIKAAVVPSISADDAKIAAFAGFGSFDVFSAELQIYTESGRRQLVYHIITDYMGGTAFFVDAVSGDIIDYISLQRNMQPVIITDTDHLGNEISLEVEKTVVDGNDVYRLNDGYRNITVYDMHDGTAVYNSSVIESETGDFDGKDISAYNNFVRAFDFFVDESNSGVATRGVDNSLNNVYFDAFMNSELKISVYVNYGTNYSNAFYAGGLANKNISFMFGTAVDYVVAGDVTAHEYQHAINAYNASFVYRNASGALDEAIADLFGSLVEGKEMDDPEFWRIGEDMGSDIMRDAASPSKGYRASVNSQYPFCYLDHSHNACDNGGVHFNATIITHAVYRMHEYAARNGIGVFNKKNLGQMLYSTLVKCTPTIGWSEYRAIFDYSANSLRLTSAERAKIRECIAYGFDYVGITMPSPEDITITFALPEGFTGDLPAPITVPAGSSFSIPQSGVGKEGYKLVGWTDEAGEVVYLIGEEYESPPYSVTLYPVAVVSWNDLDPIEWEGEGNRNNPYIISKAEDLASLAYYMNIASTSSMRYLDGKYFKMTANISLYSLAWVPIGTGKKAPAIHFDGNGYTVSNLLLEGNYEYQGLFGVVNGSVRNLGIHSGRADVQSVAAGGIAGAVGNGGIIENCYSNMQIINTADTGTAGGIAGVVENSAELFSIKNCYNTGSVEANIAGGIVGNITKKLIANCYNTGEISGVVVGGIAGKAIDTSFVNCINTGAPAVKSIGSGDKVLGGIAGIAENRFGTLRVMGCKDVAVGPPINDCLLGSLVGKIDAESVGFEKNIIRGEGVGNYSSLPNAVRTDINAGITISTDAVFSGDFDFGNREYYLDFEKWSVFSGASVFDLNSVWQYSPAEMPQLRLLQYWDDVAAQAFGGGTGYSSDPYRIGTPEQLALLLRYVNNGAIDDDGVAYSQKSYIQTADIDLSGNKWTGIGLRSMYGDITVGTLSFSGSYDGDGYMISEMNAVEKIGYDEVDGTVIYSYASLFSFVSSGAEIRNVTLQDCLATGSDFAALLVYSLSGSARMYNCYATGGAVTARGTAAGLIATANGAALISDCVSDVFVSAQIAAGIIGELRNSEGRVADVIRCVNKGEIAGYKIAAEDVGAAGIAGEVSSGVEILDCVNVGLIRSDGVASGLIGYALAEVGGKININGCKQTGVIQSDFAVGVIGATCGGNGGIEVDITNTHYTNVQEISLIDEDKINAENSFYAAIDGGYFDFTETSYYDNDEIFYSSASMRLNLFMSVNYVRGYRYVAFIDEDYSLLDMQRVKRGDAATPPDLQSMDEYFCYTAVWSGPYDSVRIDTILVSSINATKRIYTIAFVSNGGSAVDDIAGEYSEDISRPANPTRRGYKFAGWYTDSELKNEFKDFSEITQDLTLYAKWEKNSAICSSVSPIDTAYMSLVLVVVLTVAMLVFFRKQERKSGQNA